MIAPRLCVYRTSAVERAGGVSRIQSVSVFRTRLTACPRCIQPDSVTAFDISTANFALCMSMIVLQTRVEGHLEEKKEVSSLENDGAVSVIAVGKFGTVLVTSCVQFVRVV